MHVSESCHGTFCKEHVTWTLRISFQNNFSECVGLFSECVGLFLEYVELFSEYADEVATISRLLKSIGLFCKRAL